MSTLTDHRNIHRLMDAVESLSPTCSRLGWQQLESRIAHFSGNWYLYSVVVSGVIYWPVLNEHQHQLVDGHAGWDKVAMREGISA